MEIVEALKAELEQVNQKLAALEQIKSDRAELTAQSTRLKKAIATLLAEPVVRKPMSPEARERIRIGLEKARAAKVAANAPAQAAKPVALSEAVVRKQPTGEKGAARG